jgi:hypothetical protein
MAWGVALGLNADIEAVLQRTVSQSVAAGRQTGWYPLWFVGPAYSGGFGAGGGATPGLYSGTAIPDIGSMMSSLGSIGSTGGGAGGGSFGGGGGGGGGGAGGGF